jgi:hypothetical protein
MASPIVNKIRAKVTRAKQHIQDFKLGLGAFYDTSPYEVAMKEDARTGKRIYYVKKADPVPDSLTAIAADLIQNLRSPLDHIAYQLVLDARSSAEPDWKVYYPIARSAADYQATRRGAIKGVGKEVIDAIDATEPYKGGKGHALWQLNEINKPDKHRLLIGAGAAYGIDLIAGASAIFSDENFTRFDDPLFVFPVGASLRVLNPGNHLYIEPIDSPMAKNRRFAFYIALDAPGVVKVEWALKTLQDMAELVDDIVFTLGRFLP